MLDKYEKFVEEQWYGPSTIEYTSIGFAGEAGEVLNEIKKELRDGTHRQELIRDELGDTLYYFTHLCRLYGYSITDIMEANIRKLSKKVSVCGIQEN